MKLRGALAAVLVLVAASCGDTQTVTAVDSEAADVPSTEASSVLPADEIEELSAPVGLVSAWEPLVAGDVTAFGEAGSTQLVEVSVLLAFGDEPVDVVVSAGGGSGSVPVSPELLTLVPGVPSTVQVSVAFGAVGEFSDVDVLFRPVSPPLGDDSGEGELTARVLVEAVAVGAPVPPLVAGDMVELGEGVSVDVLANDVAVQGSLDPGSLRIVSVESEQLGAGDFLVEAGGIRVTAAGPFLDGALVIYEVCDTAGLCNTNQLLSWMTGEG